MKSIPKLLRRFAAILAVSSVFLLVINFLAFALLVAWQSPRTATSPYELAAETGRALQVSDDGGYALPEEMSSKLSENHAWAILIDNRSLCVVWRNDAVPSNIPTAYTLSDIAALTTGYLDGYPTYTGENEAGIVVLGFPRDSFWKHTRASWNYSFISNLPQIVLAMLSVNIFIIFLMCISAYIIFYFRGGRKLKVETDIESTLDNNVNIQL